VHKVRGTIPMGDFFLFAVLNRGPGRPHRFSKTCLVDFF